jgi:ferritin-like metal-binding protein YciE
MATETLNDLFYDTLRDMYWAEKHLLKALPKLAKKASNPDLIQALENHLEETETHVQRLERVFEIIDKPARAKKCEAMVGLSAEADHVLEETEKGMVRDAGIIGAAQAVEHYEIARYGTLAAWAEILELIDAKNLLGQTLEEEEAADELLTEVSEGVNPSAEAEGNREAA